MLCFFDDDENKKLNAHQLAWRARDWDAVKKLSDEFAPDKKKGLFDALNNINYGKDENMTMPDGYSSYIVNNLLSNHIDCLPYVQYANMMIKGLPESVHYDYMLKVIPKGKRFNKSLKSDDPLVLKYALKLIAKFYSVNHFKAYSYYELMNKKGTLDSFLKRAKALATDDFLKTISKNPKEIKEMKLL